MDKVMTEKEAWHICNEIKNVLTKHGIWYKITVEHKPKLKFIVISDISIKVDGERKNTQ